MLRLHGSPIHFTARGKWTPRRRRPRSCRRRSPVWRRNASARKRSSACATSQKWDVCPRRSPRPCLRSHRPDRNRPETQALEAASVALRCSTAQLLSACAIVDIDYHFGRFRRIFPKGWNFLSIPSRLLASRLPAAGRSAVVRLFDRRHLDHRDHRRSGQHRAKALVTALLADGTDTHVHLYVGLNDQSNTAETSSVHSTCSTAAWGAADRLFAAVRRDQLDWLPGRAATIKRRDLRRIGA